MTVNHQRAQKQLLRLPEVLERIPVSRSSWYEGVRLGIYPSPVRIGKRSVAWRSKDIDRLTDGLQNHFSGDLL